MDVDHKLRARILRVRRGLRRPVVPPEARVLLCRPALPLSVFFHLLVLTAWAFARIDAPLPAILPACDVRIGLPDAGFSPPDPVCDNDAGEAEPLVTGGMAEPEVAAAPTSLWSQVRREIARHTAYPPAAHRRGLEGSAVVELSLAPDGRLLSADALEATADAFRDAALQAVRRAEPFACVTNYPAAAPLTAVLPIRFRLNKDPTQEEDER